MSDRSCTDREGKQRKPTSEVRQGGAGWLVAPFRKCIYRTDPKGKHCTNNPKAMVGVLEHPCLHPTLQVGVSRRQREIWFQLLRNQSVGIPAFRNMGIQDRS